MKFDPKNYGWKKVHVFFHFYWSLIGTGLGKRNFTMVNFTQSVELGPT